MVRGLLRAFTVVVILAIALLILDFAELLVPVTSKGTASMAPTIPACDGRMLAEGFTYKLRDPRRGEVVVIHAAGELGGEITPDSDADDLELTARIVGLPGDQVVGRDESVFVNGIKLDDIATAPFPRVDVPSGQYFVLGDNRSASQDSREFGPVLREAIFGRVLLVFWPLRDFTFRTDPESGVPPGPVDCS